MSFSKRYLPTGEHRKLIIQRRHIIHTGPFTHGGWKLIWHTTEGGNMESVYTAVRRNRSEPHCIIEPKLGLVEQLIPFDEYARTLKHPVGTPETNKAHCIQVEIIGFAKDAPEWSEHIYRNLARLALLIEHRKPIPRVVRHPFGLHVRRLTSNGFVRAAGHLGHQHVPNNDHWDPGKLRAKHIVNLMERV